VLDQWTAHCFKLEDIIFNLFRSQLSHLPSCFLFRFLAIFIVPNFRVELGALLFCLFQRHLVFHLFMHLLRCKLFVKKEVNVILSRLP
jgi:hypothetical protein